MLCKATSLYFSPAPPSPLPAPAEDETARPRHRGSPPRQRTAPFGPGSTVPCSASGGRGSHTDFGKRCFWVVLPAGVWSRATTEWIETRGAGLTALNGHPNHVDYGASTRPLLFAAVPAATFLASPRVTDTGVRPLRGSTGGPRSRANFGGSAVHISAIEMTTTSVPSADWGGDPSSKNKTSSPL